MGIVGVTAIWRLAGERGVDGHDIRLRSMVAMAGVSLGKPSV